MNSKGNRKFGGFAKLHRSIEVAKMGWPQATCPSRAIVLDFLWQKKGEWVSASLLRTSLRIREANLLKILRFLINSHLIESERRRCSCCGMRTRHLRLVSSVSKHRPSVYQR